MRKNCKKLFILVMMLVLLPMVVNAEYKIEEKIAFNYGGSKNDVFYDIDFFSDGSYVVVGNSESTFRTVTNTSPNSYHQALMVVYDKNNNVVTEKIYDPDLTAIEPTYSSFYKVVVVDDNSFVACGDNLHIPFCAKFNKNGEKVWQYKITDTASDFKERFDIVKTSDNGFLVSHGSLLNKAVKLNANGELVYTITDVNNINAVYEATDNYILVGGSNKTVLYEIDKTTGAVISNTTYAAATSSSLYDIDKISSGYLLSANSGVGEGKTTFSENGDVAVLAKIDSDYDIEKKTSLDVTHNMKTMVVDDMIISVLERATTPTSSKIYIHDKNLNKLAEYEYKFDKYFSLRDLKLNPVNKNVYLVGSTAGNVGSHANLGEKDAVVVSLGYTWEVEDELANEEKADTPISDEEEKKEETKVEEQKQEETKKEKETVDNPKTGNYLPVAVVLVLTALAISIILYTKKKNKLTRI